MSITHQRIETLNQLSAKNKSIVVMVEDITSATQHNSGTRVIIRFPLTT